MTALLALILGSAPVAPTGDAAGVSLPQAFRPIPREDLQGTKLVPRGEAFTIESPGEEWLWVVVRDQTTPAPITTKRVYNAFDPRTKEVLSLYVIPDPNGRAVNEEFMRGFEGGYRDRTNVTRRLRSFVFAPVDEPLKGAFRFAYIIDRAYGPTLYHIGYATGVDPKYIFLSSSTREGEPNVLAHWIGSFRQLEY